jgi:hypothetical protein
MATRLLVLNQGCKEIQSLAPDGTDIRTVVDGLDQAPDGIIADEFNRHIYWTNMGPPTPESRIRSRHSTLVQGRWNGSTSTVVTAQPSCRRAPSPPESS